MDSSCWMLLDTIPGIRPDSTYIQSNLRLPRDPSRPPQQPQGPRAEKNAQRKPKTRSDPRENAPGAPASTAHDLGPDPTKRDKVPGPCCCSIDHHQQTHAQHTRQSAQCAHAIARMQRLKLESARQTCSLPTPKRSQLKKFVTITHSGGLEVLVVQRQQLRALLEHLSKIHRRSCV